MRVPRSFPVITLLASLLIVQIVGPGLFLLEFFDVVADTHGLEVAPQTHEDVEVGQETHQASFVVVEERI